MAKNYTLAEAARIVFENKNYDEISNIGTRFPLLLALLVKNANEAFIELMAGMPEQVSALKVNTRLKDALLNGSVAADTDMDEDDETTADDVEDTVEGDDYDNMPLDALWALIDKHGLRKKVKARKKSEVIATLKKYVKNDVNEEQEDTVDEDPYDGMSPMELYKECVKRGLKVEQKKPATYYTEKLIAFDNDAPSDDGWDEPVNNDDEWDIPTEKETKKAAKASKAKKAPVEDDDDEWKI